MFKKGDLVTLKYKLEEAIRIDHWIMDALVEDNANYRVQEIHVGGEHFLINFFWVEIKCFVLVSSLRTVGFVIEDDD